MFFNRHLWVGKQFTIIIHKTIANIVLFKNSIIIKVNVLKLGENALRFTLVSFEWMELPFQ